MLISRHFLYFISLGLFWGLSPSFYKHLADIKMPASHTIFITGLGVGVAMLAIAAAKSSKARSVTRMIWAATK